MFDFIGPGAVETVATVFMVTVGTLWLVGMTVQSRL